MFLLFGTHVVSQRNKQRKRHDISSLTDAKQEDIKDGVITGSLPRRALRLVYEWLDLHQEELMANWERLGKSEAPIKITPLQ